jgi:hypothetical protein
MEIIHLRFFLIGATLCIAVLQLKRTSGQKDTDADLDGKTNPIEQEECAANGEDANSEYHEGGDMENNIDEISQDMATAVTVDNGGLAAKSGGKSHESSAKLDMQSSVLPEVCHAGLRFFHVQLDLSNNWVINLVQIFR